MSGGYFTSIGCRWALARHRRPGWYLILLGTCVTVLLTALCAWGAALYVHPEEKDEIRGGFEIMVIAAVCDAAVFAFAASVSVVSFYRAKFQDKKDVV